jgi:hypothetical protein
LFVALLLLLIRASGDFLLFGILPQTILIADRSHDSRYVDDNFYDYYPISVALYQYYSYVNLNTNDIVLFKTTELKNFPTYHNVYDSIIELRLKNNYVMSNQHVFDDFVPASNTIYKKNFVIKPYYLQLFEMELYLKYDLYNT